MTTLELRAGRYVLAKSELSDGQLVRSEHDLDLLLGNRSGHFDPNSSGVSSTAGTIVLHGDQLLAALNDSQGGWVENEIIIQALPVQIKGWWTHEIAFLNTGYSAYPPLDREHPPLNDSDFDDCRNLRLTGSATLVAHCDQRPSLSSSLTDQGRLEHYRKHGRYSLCHLDLDECLGNTDGRFDSSGSKFSLSAGNIRLSGTLLSAELRTISGELRQDSICLTHVIRCSAGHLRSPIQNVLCGCLKDHIAGNTPHGPIDSSHRTTLPHATIYEPLPAGSQHIRLCHIEPREWTDQLSCSIETLSVAGIGPYKCLSYVWGDQTPTVTIKLNGLDFEVGANLYQALRRLRWRGKIGPIWIDAICINQQNDEEKAAQVARMADIYAGAEQVLIWFGEIGEWALDNIPSGTSVEDWQSIRGDKVLSGLFRAAAADCHIWEAIRPAHITSHGQQRAREYPTYYLLRLLLAFYHFGWNEWLKRMWTLQEILMAREAVTLFGGEAIRWSDIEVACSNMARHWSTCCSHLQQRDDERQVRSALLACARNLSAYRNLAVSRNIILQPPALRIPTEKMAREYGLLALLSQCRRRRASDPRDKLYGLYSCVREAFPSLRPDYSISSAELFAQFTVDMINRMGNFDIWDLQCPRNENPATAHADDSLPSWVLDWTRDPNTGPLDSNFARNINLPSLCETYTSKTDTSPIARREANGFLSLSGSIVDTIASSTPAPIAIKTTAHLPTALEHWLATLTTTSTSAPAPRATLWRALLQNSILADDFDSTPHTSSDATAPTKALLIPSDRRFWRPLTPPDIEACEAWLRHPHEGRQITSTLLTLAKQKVLFRTRAGRLGFGPRWLREGDGVGVVVGARTPVVFRGGARARTVVGSCFVPGLMPGEGVVELGQRLWIR